MELKEIPETIDINTAKENGNVNRLKAQEKNLNTILYQNKNGTKTVYNFDYPVKYVDKDGTVKDKNSKLVTNTDKQGYKYVNDGNDIKTFYPDLISPEKGMILNYNNINIELSPIN
ncbi:MAG: hypothetical protein RR306_06685, partial [Clostridia bacterium]